MTISLSACKAAAPVLAIALAACGGQNVGLKPVVEFPDHAKLVAIGAKPAGKLKLPETAGPNAAWKIEQTLPEKADGELWTPEGPWETLFAEVAAKRPRPPRITRALHCVARELGTFYLKHKALPSEGLHRFILGACGAVIPTVGAPYIAGDVPAGATPEQTFEKWGKDLRPKLEKHLGGSVNVAGFWFGQDGGRAVALMVLGEEKAQIKPFSLIPNEQGEVTIEGRLNEPVQYLSAHINQGRAGVESCDMDMSVRRPSFRVICRPAADDPVAWIQLFSAPPKRVLSEPFAHVLVRRAGDVVPVYEEMSYAESRPVSSPQEFTRAALEQLNQARAEAGLRPVTLARQQSATATRLAPHYFAAAFGETEPEQADTIALGLLAGWEVPGMIRGASLTSGFVPHTLDAGRWLSAALEMPNGRKTLFSPDIEQVSFGPLLMRGPDALGAVVTGYQFHHKNEHDDDVRMLLSRVVVARRGLGLAEPLRLGTMAEVMKEELAAVHEGRTAPMDALDNVLGRGVGRFQAPMRGFVIEAASLDELELPEEVVRQSTLHLDIGVTHHKAPGAAWAQFTILVIYVDFSGRST